MHSVLTIFIRGKSRVFFDRSAIGNLQENYIKAHPPRRDTKTNKKESVYVSTPPVCERKVYDMKNSSLA